MSICGKVEYPTWTGADHAARSLRRHSEGSNAQPYPCGGHFHVGNHLGGNVGARLKRAKLRKIERREAWA